MTEGVIKMTEEFKNFIEDLMERTDLESGKVIADYHFSKKEGRITHNYWSCLYLDDKGLKEVEGSYLSSCCPGGKSIHENLSREIRINNIKDYSNMIKKYNLTKELILKKIEGSEQ